MRSVRSIWWIYFPRTNRGPSPDDAPGPGAARVPRCCCCAEQINLASGLIIITTKSNKIQVGNPHSRSTRAMKHTTLTHTFDSETWRTGTNKPFIGLSGIRNQKQKRHWQTRTDNDEHTELEAVAQPVPAIFTEQEGRPSAFISSENKVKRLAAEETWPKCWQKGRILLQSCSQS
jgi:hypothetical protein